MQHYRQARWFILSNDIPFANLHRIMALRLKIRLIGLLILLIGFAVIQIRKQSDASVEIPEIDAIPQLEPEYTVNIESPSDQ